MSIIGFGPRGRAPRLTSKIATHPQDPKNSKLNDLCTIHHYKELKIHQMDIIGPLGGISFHLGTLTNNPQSMDSQQYTRTTTFNIIWMTKSLTKNGKTKC